MIYCYVQVSCPGREGPNAKHFKRDWTKFLAARSDKVEIRQGGASGKVTRTQILKLDATWEDCKGAVSAFFEVVDE